jgi:hypothetical protein
MMTEEQRQLIERQLIDARISRLLIETRIWREEHKERKRHIEAAACAIRERALREALEIVRRPE